MHFVVIGGSGFIGREIVNEIHRRGQRVTVVGRQSCDLYDHGSLARHLSLISPDAVINAAGYVGRPNVDACESNKSECLAANAVLPGVIASACRMNALPWGHVSSGCIYSSANSNSSSFSELDTPNFTFRKGPCSFYSGTKALGEEILRDCQDCYIWRIRIPFSNRDCQKNYLTKLMNYDRLLEATNSLSNLDEFVSATVDCFQKQVPFGTYNLTNPGAISTSEVVDLIRQSGIINREFKFFRSEQEFMSLAAKTPRSNCVLDTSKASDAGLVMSPIRESLKKALQTWVTQDHQSSSVQFPVAA